MELALKKAYNLKGKDLIDFSRRFDSEKKKSKEQKLLMKFNLQIWLELNMMFKQKK